MKRGRSPPYVNNSVRGLLYLKYVSPPFMCAFLSKLCSLPLSSATDTNIEEEKLIFFFTACTYIISQKKKKKMTLQMHITVSLKSTWRKERPQKIKNSLTITKRKGIYYTEGRFDKDKITRSIFKLFFFSIWQDLFLPLESEGNPLASRLPSGRNRMRSPIVMDSEDCWCLLRPHPVENR